MTERKRKTAIEPGGEIRDIPQYFSLPSYTIALHPAAGGQRSDAVLGPYVERGSTANSDLPVAIKQARIDFGHQFKSGHLLNQEFGGSGKDPTNLTILTHSANATHTGFDNPIKRARQGLWDYYNTLNDLYVDYRLYPIGIYVCVSTSGGSDPASVWDTTHATGRYIYKWLDCYAELRGFTPEAQALLTAFDKGAKSFNNFSDDRKLHDYEKATIKGKLGIAIDGIAEANKCSRVDNGPLTMIGKHEAGLLIKK